MLKISSRYVSLPAFRYIAELIFGKWYTGHNLILEQSNYNGYILISEAGEALNFKSGFFEHVEQFGFTQNILDHTFFDILQTSENFELKFGLKNIPTISFFEKARPPFFSTNQSSVNFDILGACFFIITRLEEFLKPSLDNFGRHAGKQSLSFEFGYLYIPLIDLYCEILIDYLNKNLSTVFIRAGSYSDNITCDVDNPFLFDRNRLGILKRSAADVIIRRDIPSASANFIGALLPLKNAKKLDPFANGVNYIMDINSKYSNKVRFNFIPLVTDDRFDGVSGFQSLNVKNMLCNIHNRGHQIGIHPGFNTYLSRDVMKKSVNVFKERIFELTRTEFISGRQHYLRWKTGETEQIICQAGINEDSSLSYADAGGFRCGTSKAFPLYDLSGNRVLSTIEQPLVVMETTYFGQGYLNVRNEDVFNSMSEMKNWCKKTGGTFTLLWHNCGLQSPLRKEIYEQILAA